MEANNTNDGKDKTPEKEYKTPDYVRRAKLNYAKKKMETDPEYKQKMLENNRRYLEKNRDLINQKRREHRAQQKQESQQVKGDDKPLDKVITIDKPI